MMSQNVHKNLWFLQFYFRSLSSNQVISSELPSRRFASGLLQLQLQGKNTAFIQIWSILKFHRHSVMDVWKISKWNLFFFCRILLHLTIPQPKTLNLCSTSGVHLRSSNRILLLFASVAVRGRRTASNRVVWFGYLDSKVKNAWSSEQ